MEIRGAPDETDRLDVIAYLRTLADTPVPLPSDGIARNAHAAGDAVGSLPVPVNAKGRSSASG
ncbi:hypothetical protein [Rhizobium leguminosarum]|uniref:hypothetical protein n=1 Tax=Rhizobium leguminosarum TaxID=384 RepID=UPI00031E66DE|nr:hypothetical protein [Rhizobium leguminosarum]